MGASYSQQSNPSEGKAPLDTLTLARQEREEQDNNKMDTVTMARQEREKNGPWETEISYGGEADLHRHLVGCEKNPGHLNFVPVDLFDVDCLPSFCQDKLLVEMIRTMADLTVRVSVKYVSERRPETFPGSGTPYPYYRNRGRDMMRVGTGWVYVVNIYPCTYNFKKTCRCTECLNSPTPKTQFATITISTAAHVVYDDLEAAKTTCHLFYDRGGTPDVCYGVIALSDMSRVTSDAVNDFCSIQYFTHDLDLAHRLDRMVDHRINLECKVKSRYNHRINHNTKYSNQATRPVLYPLQNLESQVKSRYNHRINHNIKYSNQATRPVLDPLQKLAIIVSHPHGCSKQVSVGNFADKDEWENGLTQCLYTTATCPGSSGAYVCVLGEVDERYIYLNHIHCGNYEGNNELNISSCTRHSYFNEVEHALSSLNYNHIVQCFS